VAVSRAGRNERANSAEGRVKKPNLTAIYSKKMSSVTAGDFEFRLKVYGGARAHVLRNVTSFSWADEESALTGSVSLQRGSDAPNEMQVAAGDRMACDVRAGGSGSWFRLWVMEVQAPGSDSRADTIQLADDMIRLKRGKRDWAYRTTRSRKRGWFAHEIARDVARKIGVRVGTLAKGTKRIRRLVKDDALPLAVLIAAYAEEAKETGLRFVIRLRDGKLEIVPLRRNGVIYVIDGNERSIDLQESQKKNPVTVINAKARIGRGKDAKKVKATVTGGKAVVDRFGEVEKDEDYGVVKTRAEMIKLARRDLAEEVRITRTATLSIGGIPFLRRGDGCRWITREAGWHGSSFRSKDRSYAFVRAARHSVDPGEYVTEIDLVQDDPFLKDQERLDKERREKAEQRRKRARKT
jgi:hypothetical protein